MIWGYSVAVRAPTDPPKCKAHFPELPKRKVAKGSSKLRSSREPKSKVKNQKPPSGLSSLQKQLWRYRHPFVCTCPAVEVPRFYPCGSKSFDFEKLEEQDHQDPRPDKMPVNRSYKTSEYPGILTACKRTREGSLALFYNTNKFLFPGSHSRHHDRQVMRWLLARREHLKNFHHIEWYAPTDEIGLRSYAVIIMLVELGILRGTVVRRSRLLIDRKPMASDGINQGYGILYTVRPRSQGSSYEPLMRPVASKMDDDCHILCGLRLAVRERIQQKRICMTAVLYEDVEEVEEMMSAVAGKFWRGCSWDWCNTSCRVCSSNFRRMVGEPVLKGIPGREKDKVPGKSQTSAEDEALLTL
jgi:hypothetical protein